MSRAKELLKKRLVTRGLVPSVAVVAVLREAAAHGVLGTMLASSTTRAAATLASGEVITGIVPSARVLLLTRSVLRSLGSLPKLILMLLVALLTLTLVGYAAYRFNDVETLPSDLLTLSEREAEVANEPVSDPDIERLPRTLPAHVKAVDSMVFSPDGRWLATGGKDNQIHLWDRKVGKHVHQLKGHLGDISALAFSPDGETLASGQTNKGVVKLWHTASGSEQAELELGDSKVVWLDFTADGERLLTVDSADRVKFWDAKSGKSVKTVSVAPGEATVTAATFSEDRKLLLLAVRKAYRLSSSVGELQVWEHESWTLNKKFRVDNVELHFASVAISSDNRKIAWKGFQRQLAVLDWESGKTRTLNELATVTSEKIAFIPGTSLLAAQGDNATLQFWDTEDGSKRGSHKLPCFGLNAIAISPDGKLIAASGIHLNTPHSEGAVYVRKVQDLLK